MAQYARPDGDVTRTNVASGTYADIDESSYSDSDYLYGTNNTAVTYECSLSDVDAPGSGTRTIRYRVVKTNAGTPDGGGSACSVTAYLVQGTSVLQTDTTRTLDGTWTTYEMVVTATITDYTDVRLRFYSVESGGSAANRRSVGLSWAEFEIPDAAPASVTVTLDTLTLASSIPAGDVIPGGVNVLMDTLNLTGSVQTLSVYIPVSGVDVPLNTLSLVSSIPAGSVGIGGVNVPLDTLNLTGSVQSLSVIPGAVSITLGTLNLTGGVQSLSVSLVSMVTVALNTLNLTGSIVDISVVPGPTSVLLDTLNLAGSVETLTVIPGEIIVVLDTLNLAGSVETLLVAITAGITVELDTLTLTSRVVKLASPGGRGKGNTTRRDWWHYRR